MQNQLLSNDILSLNINLQLVTSKHFSEAFEYLLPLAKNEHIQMKTVEPTYDNLFHTFKSEEKLMQCFHLLSSLISMTGDDALRIIQEKYSPDIINMMTEHSLDIDIFNQIQKLSQSKEFNTLEITQQKIIEDIIKDLKLSGIDLPQDKKEELGKINVEIDTLRQSFEKNITDLEEQLGFSAKKEELKGLNQRILNNAKSLALELNKKDYWFDMNSGLYSDVLTYCENEELRKKVYEDELMIGRHEKFNNIPIISKIHQKLHEKANILGYANYADMALFDNMAKNTNNVSEFLNKIGNLAKPQAIEETQSLKTFGQQLLKKEKLDPWDYSFVEQKYKDLFLNVDYEKIREYFPIKRTIDNTLSFLGNLFNISIKEKSMPSWDKEVLYYEIFESDKQESIASFFIDIYARDGKMPGAWVDGIVTRDFEKNNIKPIAFLSCNNPFDKGQVSTFEWDEVVTLFHELGHLLHHCLTKIDYSYFSGFNQVKHDAIEFPSQLLENFVYQYQVIETISNHIKSGEPLPFDEFDKLFKAKNFGAASIITKFVSFSEMDLELYKQNEKDPIAIEINSKEKWKINENTDMNNFRMPKFSHIFGGGYESGYYAYQWAEVLSLDALSIFNENFSDPNKLKEIAQQYKTHVLETGGSLDMEENFINFIGRKPDVNHYLKHYGIHTPENSPKFVK